MIKIREAGYCNLKLLLIFLVVYGHLIEKQIGKNDILQEIYRWIYLVHMPLFAFLSGFFLKGIKNSLNQMKRSFLYYCCLQVAIYFIMKETGWEPVSLAKPYWHLWYLLSLSNWAGIACLWNLIKERFRVIQYWIVKIALAALAIVLACLVGGVTEINRMYSLSRTLVFMPYMLVGLFCPNTIQWERYRALGVIALMAAVLVNQKWGRNIPISFLYQAESYGNLYLGAGIWLRLICYVLGFCLGLFLLTWIPQKRFPCSKAGANTMGIYVCHALFVKLIWKIDLPIEVFVYLGPVIAGGIVWWLFKIFQWNAALFVVKEVVPGGDF